MIEKQPFIPQADGPSFDQENGMIDALASCSCLCVCGTDEKSDNTSNKQSNTSVANDW